VYLLCGNVLGSLAGPLLDDLEGLVGLVLDGFPLDGRSKGLGSRVVVTLKLGAARKTFGVLSEEVVKGCLELDLLQAIVATGSAGKYALACFLYTATDRGNARCCRRALQPK
jgi:hypothetical protein